MGVNRISQSYIAHLYTLLYYLHPMLQRQKIHYCVFVIEQVDDGRFNKGLVMNSGFQEIRKTGEWDCVVFHDVDMIPEDDRNLYLCQNEPTHLSPLIDKFGYQLRSKIKNSSNIFSCMRSLSQVVEIFKLFLCPR